MTDLPDNDTTDADLTIGAPVSSILETPTDTDWIRFVGESGTAYWFHLSFDADADDSAELMHLRTTGAPPISIFAGGFGDAVLAFTPTDTLPAYIAVSNSNTLIADADKSYTLTAHLVDDAAAGADTNRSISKTESVVDLFETQRDRDWFAMQVTAGESYEILFEAFSQGTQATNLAVRDSAGALLSELGQSPHDLGVLYEATTTGTVYLDLGRDPLTERVGAFGYRLSVAEPGDTVADDTTTALQLTSGTPTEFRIDHGDDRDWLRMTLDAGQYYRAAVVGESSSLGIDAVLRDASGSIVTTNALDGFGFATGGTFYLDVGLNNSAASDVTANLIETDDIPGTTATFETIAPGGSYVGDIPQGRDTDLIAFDVTAGFDYLIDISLARDYFGRNFSIFRDDESLLSVSPDTQRTGFLSHSADRDERLHIVIENDTVATFDQYTITLEQATTDGIAGSSLTSATIALGEVVNGTVDYGADRDWYRFSAEAGVIYEVSMSGTSAANVGVREIDGSEVAPHDGRISNSVTNYFSVDSDRDVFVDAGRHAIVERTGSYTLTVEVSPDTVMNDQRTLSVILPNMAVDGRTDYSRDFDFYRFEAEAGRSYAFVTQRVTESNLAQIDVYDEEGYRFWDSPFSQTAPAVVHFDAQTDETLYLSALVSIEENYRLSVVDTTNAMPGSSASATTLNLGEVVNATVDNGSDTDWFALDLEDGQTYFASVSNHQLLSGTVSIRSSNGTVIEAVDLNPGEDTSLQIEGASDRFLVVEGLALPDAKDFSVSLTTEVSGAFEDQTAPLFTGLATGFSMAGVVDDDGLRTITYSFANGLEEFLDDGTTSFRSDRRWNDYEESRIASALNLYADTLNIEFTERNRSRDADITFYAAELNGLFSRNVFTSEGELGFAFLPTNGPFDGNIVLNVDGFGWDPNAASGDTFDGGLEQFGFGAQTVLHEIGHALGLDHPFESNEFSTMYPGIVDADGDGVSDDEFGDSGSFGLNQSAYTVMSYVDGWTEHPFGTGNIFLSEQFFGLPSDPGGHIGTPMALDVAALQTIYGANQTTNAGNDLYILPDTQAQTTGYALIWDTGGSDTISYAGTRDVVLDLRAATLEVEEGGGGFISFVNEATPTDPVLGGFAIAHGVTIETAESGAGDDNLTGNAASNTLIAGAGNDTLSGNAGNNTLTGGAGADLFIIADKTGNDTITDFAAGEDQIDVQALELTFSQLVISDDAGDSRISFTTASNTGSILLQGVAVASVVESDFIISPTATGTSITGTTGDDVLTGGVLDEVFFGLDGNDTITANAGNDSLEGDAGNDTVIAGEGDDVLFGSAGNDTLQPGAGNDSIEGGENADDADLLNYSDAVAGVAVTLAGDEAGSVVSGADTDSFIEIEQYLLSPFADSFDGSSNASGISVAAGNGSDSLLGGAGNDTLEGGVGADSIDGDTGIDTASYATSSAGVSVNLSNGSAAGGDAAGDTLISIENVTGSEQSDTLTGDGQANTLTGLGGNDTLNGGAGADTMDGGLGNDRFFVDDAGDVVIEAVGEGTDLISTPIDFTLPDNVEQGSTLGTGDVAITGNALANFITGNAGANTVDGAAGNDRLITFAGDDVLTGGAGNDILEGGTGSDRFVVTANNSDDQIIGWEASTDVLDFGVLGLRFVDLAITSSGNEALITFDDPAGGTGSVRLVGIDPEALEIGIMTDPGGLGSPGGVPLTAGSTGADNLAATNGDDDVVGLAGNDILNGRAGADTMVGGFGNDRYFLDEAGDLVIEQQFQGTDQMDASFSFTLSEHVESGAVLGGGALDITGNALGNFITGSALSNVLSGLDGRDRLIAFDGDDTLAGGLDNDVLEGGAGADVFLFEADSGIDLITDFEVGTDLIDVTALGLAFSDLTIVDGGLGTLVIFDLTPSSVDLVTLQGVSASDVGLTSFIGAPNLPIVGTEGDDQLSGTPEDDALLGLGGADLIDGRAGADVMSGGLGDDRYFVDNPGDVITELPGEGTDTVTTSVSFTLPVNVENGTAFGETSITLTGNSLSNFLVAGIGFGDILDGAGGDDNLLGTTGDDVIIGGTGDDLLRGGDDIGFFLDRFVFATGDGNDQILDFDVGLDLIDLSATGLTFDDLTIIDSGANAVITYGTDTITVLNTTAAQLDENQFDFGA